MKKRILRRGLLGAPLGLAVGYLITILISLIWADGFYSPCVPELVDAMGSEIAAVLLQAALCCLLGAGFAAASVIWEIDRWGLVKQTGVYLLLISLIMLPVAYLTYWMEHSLWGFAQYAGIFFLIFAAIWAGQYALARRNTKRMNERLRDAQEHDS